MDEAYTDWCEMMDLRPSDASWMAYCEWRAAGNEMA